MNTSRLLSLCALALLAAGCASAPNMGRLIAQKPQAVVQPLVDNWTFRMKSDSTDAQAQWIAATVPGTVHTDLMAAGVIGDPFVSTAENTLQWIETKEWSYKIHFTPSPELLKQGRQELVFKGLDTYADVYLNDSLVLSTDNMFLEWRIDVRGKLRADQNTLRVDFRNTYNEGLKALEKYPMSLPADNDKGEKKTSIFTRKAPYNFGWDWGPRFLTVGVWRPVELVGWSTARLADIQFIQTSQSEKLATFDVRARVVSATDNSAVNVILADTSGKIYAQQEIDLEAWGDTVVCLQIEIENPRLWWPNGTGEANLYPIHTVLANEGDMVKLDGRLDRIGVRTVRLVQEADSVGTGRSFYFEVNGEPVFAKGANYIPLDVFLPRVTPDKYADFIAQCKESNYNMLRVWGGGIYEEDVFYDLCDEAGIMVWQDFTFGCALYPWDSAFLENVRKEAVYNVRRLRNHPSIVIWCGNNEVSEAWHQWGFQKQYGWDKPTQDAIWNGYKALFEGVLPAVLAAEDTTRYYHPSSPLYGRGDPRSQTEGDVHYWGVFHDEEPFSAYKDKPGRFSNEYGFQSLACYDTYREYFAPEEMTLYSEAMRVHQKNPKGYRVMEEYMVRDLPLIKNNFQTYVYLTQLLQAEGIKIAMEGHRQKRPWTMGSLYWQVNDCWPVASWSSIDSRGRWKALQYYAKRSFAPTILSFERIDSTRQVKLWGITDELESKQGSVRLTLMDFSGKVLWTENLPVDIPRNGNQQILHSTEAELLKGADPRRVVLVADGVVGHRPMRALHYFVPMKDLALPHPDFLLDVTPIDGTGKVLATLTAHNLLKSVLVEADKLQGRASDAYFDLLPGETKTVELSFDAPYSIPELELKITTLGGLR